MQCRAVLGSGVQCGRESAAGAELCAFHCAIEFRAQARAFYLGRLSAEELEALADAARVQGVDGEIAVLRVLLRNGAHAGDIEGFRRGLETLCRLVQTKHHLDEQARDRLGTRLAAVLERLEAAHPSAAGPTEPEGALTPTLSQREREPAAQGERGQGGSSSALVHELRNEAQAWGRWEEALAAARAGPEEEPEPAPAREAAGLARRYQAGDAEALDLLYSRLEVAILAVLLHYRAVQVPPATRLEELQERSRAVLADLARGWDPGVSFLGYFFRTFPGALARQARRAEAAGRADVERLGAAAVDRTAQAATEALSSGSATTEFRESREQRLAADGEAREGGRAAEGPEVPFWAGDLASLPELERRVVVLRALEGQPMKWVARQVGVPEGTVSKLYERARGRLTPRGQWPEGRGSIAMRRLVRALHLAAGPDGRLANRAWAMGAAGLKRGEYDQLMGRLEGAGAIYGRRQRKPGYLAERDAAATLARVGLGDGDDAVGRA